MQTKTYHFVAAYDHQPGLTGEGVPKLEKDLSACEAPDNVWVGDEEAFRNIGNNVWKPENGPGFAAIHPNAVRFATLTPREYPGQAGFTFDATSNFRSRKKDLSACVAPDNVWIYEKTKLWLKRVYN